MYYLFVSLKLLACLLTAFSQILLKRSAVKKHSSFLKEYMNINVFVAYSIFFGVVFLNIYVLSVLELKIAAILNTSTYFFTGLLSYLILHEKISLQSIAGMLIIASGIFISVYK